MNFGGILLFKFWGMLLYEFLGQNIKKKAQETLMYNLYFCLARGSKMFLEHTYHCNVVYCYTVMQIYVQVYSVMPVRDELEKCEYICNVLCTSIQLNVLCTGIQCYVSTG